MRKARVATVLGLAVVATGVLQNARTFSYASSVVKTSARDIAGYAGYFRDYRVPPAPEVLRADLQMSGRRMVHELRRLFGVEGRAWSIRPHETAARGVRP